MPSSRHERCRPTAVMMPFLLLSVANGCTGRALTSVSLSPDGRRAAVTGVDVRSHWRESEKATVELMSRLLLVSEQGAVRAVERQSRRIFLPVTYSPDGRELCYLRIGVPQELTPTVHLETPSTGATRRLGKPVERPSTTVCVELVIRDARTGSILQTILAATLDKSEVLEGSGNGRRPGDSSARSAGERSEPVKRLPPGPPQYTPCGKQIFFWLPRKVMVYSAKDGSIREWATPADGMRLSPDGQTLATIHRDETDGLILSLLGVDGSSATTCRLAGEGFCDFTWKGNQGLVILRREDDRRDDSRRNGSGP